MQDLWRLSAADLAALVKSKKVSAKEAATAALARLDAVNPKINAVVDHRPAECWRRRHAVDAAIARGEDPGVLAGVPVTVKVNIDQARLCHHQRPETAARRRSRKDNSPVIDNLRKAGAVILGRTNCPAFSYRWFTTNLVHGDTKNPRDPAHHAGRLVRRRGLGGRGRHRPYRARHRYRGLDPLSRLCLRRAWPAADARPHRGLQRGAAGAHHRAADHRRCPARWRAPSAISGFRSRRCRAAIRAIPGGCRRRWRARRRPKRAALCLNPDGLETVPEVKAAVADAGKRLERAGWIVEEIENTPPMREAADWQTKLWLGDGYEAQLETAEREGDPGALACLRGNQAKVFRSMRRRSPRR